MDPKHLYELLLMERSHIQSRLAEIAELVYDLGSEVNYDHETAVLISRLYQVNQMLDY